MFHAKWSSGRDAELFVSVSVLLTIAADCVMLVEKIEDMPLIIDWDLRHQMAFVYELPTASVVKSLPPGILPVEARPGVSLMFLGYNDYNPGNLIDGITQPAFVEITRFFIVQPDLSIDMPMPRFTFFVDRIASDNSAFIQQEMDVLHLPTYFSPSLTVETNDGRTNAFAKDEFGSIQSLINTHPSPVYRDDSFFGQYYTLQGDELWFGVFYWSGKACIHQRPGDAGGIHDHRFLTESPSQIAPTVIGDPYLQIITTFDQPLTQRFYQPRRIRTGVRRACS